ncbi:MAG: GGDEF domain-containing protein [Treponema sp.]|nr:GGDEF domain-containing protein [Treponema sp.]
MKKIGVITTTFNIEYSTEFLNGIYDYFDDKDVCVIFSQTRLPHSTVGAYDYQYWSCIDLLTAQEIDALIVASGVYCAGISQETLEEELAKFGNRPIISAAIPLNLANSYTVLSNCKKSYLEIVEHLKNKHGCKKIAFMSANGTNSKEALERYNSFKEAMLANNLEFDKKNLFDGNFTDFQAEEALKEVLKSKEDLNFDALICANDMMAIGCYRVFKELGISVPDDVKVIGFDDAYFANYSSPRLSTINQNIYQQGYECAKAAYNISNGKKEDKTIYTDLQLKFRQSCGCILLNNLEHVYKTSNDDISSETSDKISRLNQYMNDLEEKNNIITLLDILKTSNTLRQFYYNLKHIVRLCSMKNMQINLTPIPIYLDSQEDYYLPSKMELYMYSDIELSKEVFNPKSHFNPRKKIFSVGELANKKGHFILQPIFSGETKYGYLLCQINQNKFPDYNIYLKIIVNSISAAVEYTSKLLETEQLTNKYTELQENNTTLSKQSKTDELTGVFNRRGFYELGQRTLDIVQEMEHAGIIFYADMDNLKIINDTYGHEAGDEAIKLTAGIFKQIFRSNDVVGRIGGDEFGIVASGMVIEHIPLIRKKIDDYCISESKKHKLPYVLSVSFGYADLAKSSSLKQLMSQADVMLYEEKRRKHSKKNS